MAQQYKFIASGSVGTIQLYPSGEVVTVFSGSDGDISVQGDFVCFTADTKRYSIAFGDVIKSDDTPCATANEAAEYVGGIIATYAGGGGGGGGSTNVILQEVNKTIRTFNSTLETVDGVTIGGVYSICLTTSSDFVGTINGVTRQPNFSLSLDADVMGLIPSFLYTISAGSIQIDTLG